MEKPKIKTTLRDKHYKPKCKKIGTRKEMLSLRRNFHPTTLDRLQSHRNNLHEMWKKGTFCQKCCQTKGAGNFAKSRKVAKPIQRIDEWSDSENEGSIVDEEKVVLTIEGDENGHFTMKGKINGNDFQTMVDLGSPVTIFEIDELKKIMKQKTLFIRELPSDEEYVDFNRKNLNFLGYIFCHLEVGESKLHKARILIAQKGAKSLIGRDWLKVSTTSLYHPTKVKVNKLFTKLLVIQNNQVT